MVEEALPLLRVERVQLQFDISAEFVAAQVANNVLVLAIATGRILRIDLEQPADIDDIDLPKKAADVGLIRRLFLDPSASHLIIATTSGENFYLHTQSRQPRALARLKGVVIESVAWCPSRPTASTREILIGAADGTVHEACIEPSSEFYRSLEKFAKIVYRCADGPIYGIYIDEESSDQNVHACILATPSKLLYFAQTRVKRQGSEGSGSIYSKIFAQQSPQIREVEGPAAGLSAFEAQLAGMPDLVESTERTSKEHIRAQCLAWSNMQSILYGFLDKTQKTSSTNLNDWGEITHSVKSSSEARQSFPGHVNRYIALTQRHLLCLERGRLSVRRQLDESVVFDQVVLDPQERAISVQVDIPKNTYWLFTTQNIYEIVMMDEDRDLWQIYLKRGEYDMAASFAQSSLQNDAVFSAHADHLFRQEKYFEAANAYGRSSRSFEQVALQFIDCGESDALRQYLLVKLATYPKKATMQRSMLASWLVELFMQKLDSFDDSLTSKAIGDVNATMDLIDASRKISRIQLGENNSVRSDAEALQAVQAEFEEFIRKYHADLDRQTVYEVIGGHGREAEILSYANIINDVEHILSYWTQREHWSAALDALKRSTDAELFYRYGTVLMANLPVDFIDVVTRQTALDPIRLLPALLNYNALASVQNFPPNHNQAVRYLNYCIHTLNSQDTAIHNTLISIYASHPSPNESALLAYLKAHGQDSSPIPNKSPTSIGFDFKNQARDDRRTLPYDPDFAFRLCIQHHRVQSAVHIYSSLGEYTAAVHLALKYDEIELASIVADRPAENDPSLRKRLWLEVAKKIIGQGVGVGTMSSQERFHEKRNGKDEVESDVHKDQPKSRRYGSVKQAIEFLKRCDLLRIEDLIPLFPDFIVIDDFKDEICAALEAYSRSIAQLEADMDASARTAANVKADIASLNRRYALVEPGEPCRLCQLPLLARQFFVFPSCQHGFHSDCLGSRVLARSSLAQQRRIRNLQLRLSGSSNASLPLPLQPPKSNRDYNARHDEDKRSMHKSELHYTSQTRDKSTSSLNEATKTGRDTRHSQPTSRTSSRAYAEAQSHPPVQPHRPSEPRPPDLVADTEELDGLIGAECVLCGILAIKGIEEPFITAADDPDEWAIK